MPNQAETTKSSKRISEPPVMLAALPVRPATRSVRSTWEVTRTTVHRALLVVSFSITMAAIPMQAKSQSLVASEDPTATSGTTIPVRPDLTYVLPTERTKVNNYLFDTFGPYPVASSAVFAGIDQWTNTPPEWKQGGEGFGQRYASDFAIAAIETTTRYGLAEIFKEDTLYYRCECSGLFPRVRHAVISTFTGRRGEDGHRFVSFSAILAPYAGSAAAVYGWYPDRFGAKDAFRMGNYSLLEYMGGNIALEFFYSGPHALISRMHLNSAHGSPIQGPN